MTYRLDAGSIGASGGKDNATVDLLLVVEGFDGGGWIPRLHAVHVGVKSERGYEAIVGLKVSEKFEAGDVSKIYGRVA
jgi:hypothetical protein